MLRRPQVVAALLMMAPSPAALAFESPQITCWSIPLPGPACQEPVIRQSWTNHMVEPGFVAVVDTPINKFTGVYSGRVPTDHPYEAQIGLVWADYLIDEIIAGNIRDE